jgi:hypothetical protein
VASSSYEIPALALALLSASDRSRSKDYNAYSMEWLPINGGAANVQASFTVDSSVDFVACYVTGEVTDTATPPVEDATPMFLLQLKAADRQLFDRAIHWRTIVGNAVTPFPLPFPIWLSKASTLLGTLTSLTNVARNVRLTFHGFVLRQYDKTTSRGY